MPNRTYTPNAYRYGMNGKEKDDEIEGGGNEYDFGAREYDSRLGRFWSIDPRTRDFPDWTPYLFAANCPIKFVDVNGEGPGDLFKSADDAAKDFGKTYNSQSIKENKEYITIIIKVQTDKGVKYTYLKAVRGGDANSVLRPTKEQAKNVVADAHTHGKWTADSYDTKTKEDWNNMFGPEDIEQMEGMQLPGYVATPDGKLQYYDPKKQEGKKVTVIAEDLPSDPDWKTNKKKADNDAKKAAAPKGNQGDKNKPGNSSGKKKVGG